MPDVKIENESVAELINAAFQLAYFIHDDRADAMHIAISALRKLRVESTAQGRRAYYIPTGQSGYRATRTKVSLSDLHLLQRLVYIESEVYERIAEEKRKESLSQMDMIIHFVKHLVKITLKRNSFYVSLGLTRVLYDYSTAEAIEIYNSVVQDPERARENYYYRSQKASLMRELKERFGDMLRIRKAKHGEERFEVQEDSMRYFELVKACLKQFMPWQTKCVLPTDFDPIQRVVAPLLFRGNHPDEEHSIELNRIHTLLHPSCFRRLVLGLGLDSPDRRLEVPFFFLSNDDPGSLGRRLSPPSLSKEEINVISDDFADEAVRRKKEFGRLLSIIVDGVERYRLDLNRGTRLKLEIEAGAELVEVRGRDSSQEILLATHLITHADEGVLRYKSEVKLDRGQVLSFEVSSADKHSLKTSKTLVAIRYRETRPIRMMALLLGQLKFYMLDGFSFSKWIQVPFSQAAQVSLLLLMGVAILMIYTQFIDKPKPTIVSGPEESVPPEETQTPTPSITPNVNQETEKQKAESQSSEPKPQSSQEPTIGGRGSERTRSPQQRSKPVTLLAVKRIYVSAPDNEPLSRQIREMLISGLGSIGRFQMVTGREEADAVLDVSELQAINGVRVVLALQLVNAQGKVLWPSGVAVTKTRYSGFPKNVIEQAIKDLHEYIQRMERTR